MELEILINKVVTLEVLFAEVGYNIVTGKNNLLNIGDYYE